MSHGPSLDFGVVAGLPIREGDKLKLEELKPRARFRILILAPVLSHYGTFVPVSFTDLYRR